MSEPSTQWAVRTSADLTSLLLELARALRGLAFYAESDPHRAPLVDRAHRAVASELSRAGPIDLRIDEAGFHLVGLEQPVRSEGVLAELEAALVRHRLERVRLDPTLTRHALHGLLDLLCHPRGRYETPRHFARVLAAREASGIALNELDVVSEPIRRKLSATPPRASASLGASLLQAQETSTGAGTAPRTISSGAGEDEKPSLDAEPLLAPAGDDRGERLRARLIELDQTVDDEAYGERAAEIVRWAEDLWEEELADECYRALLVLADHAVGFGGRSESRRAPQRRALPSSPAASCSTT